MGPALMPGEAENRVSKLAICVVVLSTPIDTMERWMVSDIPAAWDLVHRSRYGILMASFRSEKWARVCSAHGLGMSKTSASHPTRLGHGSGTK